MGWRQDDQLSPRSCTKRRRVDVALEQGRQEIPTGVMGDVIDVRGSDTDRLGDFHVNSEAIQHQA